MAVEIINLIKPPKIDKDKAVWAREFVENKDLGSFADLRVAMTLAIYNRAQTKDKDEAESIFDKYAGLIATEKSDSNPKNPLLSVGVEIELPRKSLYLFPSREELGTFFDCLGLPRNRAVGSFLGLNGIETPKFWEISTHSSYSAAVQSRIISELIRAGLVSSLKTEAANETHFSPDPYPVGDYLDEKMVSLHINLGFPYPEYPEVDNIYNFATPLASALAVAYSSRMRLLARASQYYLQLKMAANPNSKAKEGTQFARLEFKAFEVLGPNTYRAITEAQLLTTALVENFYQKSGSLSQIWTDTNTTLGDCFKEFGLQPQDIADKNKISKSILEKPEFVPKLRQILSVSATEIAKKITH